MDSGWRAVDGAPPLLIVWRWNRLDPLGNRVEVVTSGARADACSISRTEVRTMSGTKVAKRCLLCVSCVALSVSLLCGCAGGGAAGGSAARSEAERYPDWVRIVPMSTPEATYYVGGCMSAPNRDAAIARARADALEQVAAKARDRFTTVFDKALLDSRAQTTSTERYQFKMDGIEVYLDKLAAAAVVEDSYLRPCPDAPEVGPVCNVFVLLKLGYGVPDSVLVDTLDEFRRRLRDEGKAGLADIAERMERLVGNPPPFE